MGIKDVNAVFLRIIIIFCVAFCLLFEIVGVATGVYWGYFILGCLLETGALVCAIINLLMGRGTVQWGNGSSTKKILCIVGAVCMGLVTFWAFIALIWWNVHQKNVCDKTGMKSCPFIWTPLIILPFAFVATAGFIVDFLFRNDA